MISRSEGEEVSLGRVELDTTDIRLCFQAGDRPLHVGGPQLDFGIVRSRGDQLGVHSIEVHRPTAFLVFLENSKFLIGESIPDYDTAFVVTAAHDVFEIGRPGDTGDLRVALHLDDWIVHLQTVSHDRGILEQLDLLRHSCNGEEFVVLVELDTGHDAGAREEITRVTEMSEWTESTVGSEMVKGSSEVCQSILRIVRILSVFLRIQE